jgi:hypothetical protein
MMSGHVRLGHLRTPRHPQGRGSLKRYFPVRIKQLLGQDWYWQEFRAAVSGNASPLWQALVPTPVAADE